MLAYVFWHVRKDNVPQREYESRLSEFHARLAAQGPPGFICSASAQLATIPWLEGSAGYEDWYVLKDSGALDALEAGSVTGSMEKPHTSIASLAARGTAGLYTGREEAISTLHGATAVWFAKPDGVSYAPMFSKLEKLNPAVRSGLWQRKMTLGPTPEFCVLQSGADSLPHGWTSTLVVRRPVFP